MSGRYKITIDRGATYRLGLKPFIETDGESTPVDLTDATAELVVRDSQRTWEESYDLEIDDDQVIRIHLLPDETADYAPHRSYYYWVDVTYANGDVERLLEGPLKGGAS